MHALYETQLRRPMAEMIEMIFRVVAGWFAKPAGEIEWESGEPEGR